MNPQQDRPASSMDVASRRADRRQPIIIQNFELLPPGQTHLKRRSLSMANLFLSSASLRRETEIFSNTQIVEKIQLFNSQDSAVQSKATELSSNHPSRQELSGNPTDNYSSLRHRSAWATPRDDIQDISHLAKQKASYEELGQRTYDQISNLRQESTPVTPDGTQLSTNSQPNAGHVLNNKAKPQPGPTDTGSELGRAHSYPVLPVVKETQKKSRMKKQVTFADSVSTPWPYSSLVRDGKMWSTGNAIDEFSNKHFPDSASNGTDINNNTDIISLQRNYQNANIFRPMPTRGQSQDPKTKEPLKQYQGILKSSKSYASKARNFIDDSVAASESDSYQSHSSETSFKTTADEKSQDSVAGDERSSANNIKDNSSQLTQPPNGLGAGKIHFHQQNGHNNEDHGNDPSITTSKDSQYLQNFGHCEPSFNADANTHLSASKRTLLGSDHVNNGRVHDTPPPTKVRQNGPQAVQGEQETVGLEAGVGDSADPDNLERNPGSLEDNLSNVGYPEPQQTANVKKIVMSFTERSAEVTAYTVPQLVDSIDLTDYLSSMSRPGSVPENPPTPASAFRPGPNNARLFPKPDSCRVPSGPMSATNATNNGKTRSTTNDQVNLNNTSYMRLKFLKDEPHAVTRKNDGLSEPESVSVQVQGKKDDFDNLTIKVAGKGLELCRHPSLTNIGDQNLLDEKCRSQTSSLPARPVKPFNGQPGEAYLATGSKKPKTQGDVNTDFLMQMYLPTGERRAGMKTTQNSVNADAGASQTAQETYDAHGSAISNGNHTPQRPPSGMTTQRSRIAATITTSPDWKRGLTGNETGRRPRESRRDQQMRKLAVTREDQQLFTPRSRERQRRLLTASLTGDSSHNIDDEATLTPRAVVQARARSTSSSASGMVRGRNLSAHERTLGAMESVFLPDRQRSARGGVRGTREGVVFNMGRTQLNRRLEMLVLSTTRPNTAMERSRSNLS